MKILFLDGFTSTVGGVKPTYLKKHGHEVLNPALVVPIRYIFAVRESIPFIFRPSMAAGSN
jgi:hypothetical protein